MLTGIEGDLYFVEGIHPHPLPGPLAEQYQLNGNFMATKYDPDFEFSHWEGDGYRRTARFTKPVQTAGSNGDLPTPPGELPTKLPQEWVAFISNYTASGKLRKRGS
jgi:hypothetical protein